MACARVSSGIRHRDADADCVGRSIGHQVAGVHRNAISQRTSSLVLYHCSEIIIAIHGQRDYFASIHCTGADCGHCAGDRGGGLLRLLIIDDVVA